eukprot:TRINITY_DN7803_c0_g6_i1.p1 TRINITY_DN7803_c0_g6~~TRINITY_DN7803_c0_g6_i1.p1  ORF type:complete len:259 (-),score=16.57 TRINITY_DN7803_c0_g6_i1:238-1014(-)
MLHTFSVIPSGYTSDTDIPLQIYNCVLTLSYFAEIVDAVFCIDNEQLYQRMRWSPVSSFKNFNKMIAPAMTAATSSFRFRGDLNNDMRRFSTNLVPFPRLHFLQMNFAPLLNFEYIMSVPSLIHELWFPKSSVSVVNSLAGKCLSIFSIFRGNISQGEVDDCMGHFTDTNSSQFVEWIPNNTSSRVYSIPQHKFVRSAVMISNSTSFTQTLQRLLRQFNYMLSRKAFLHYFEMDSLEFTHADSNMSSLLNEYQMLETT